MRILICDDDALIIEQLQKYIKDFFENISVKCPELVCFSDGESLLADKGEKDILFLDIEMPGMNGIYVGKELKKKNDKMTRPRQHRHLKRKDSIRFLVLLVFSVFFIFTG